jgi:subtilisin-like proprotein convertase family protein
MNGNWTLEIVDEANADTGKLNSWTLIIGTGSSNQVMLEDAPGITIPDNNPTGIERILVSADTGAIDNIEVGIDITHSYIGDLIINLISPSGTTIPLHSKSGAGADNIIRTYNFTNHVPLQGLQGQGIQGNWKLKISDVAGQDVGKLNKWSLNITRV